MVSGRWVRIFDLWLMNNDIFIYCMNNRIVCDVSNHDEYVKYLCVHELCEYRSVSC